MAIIRRGAGSTAEIVPGREVAPMQTGDPYADVPFVAALDLAASVKPTDAQVAAIAQALFILDVGNEFVAGAAGWSIFARLQGVDRRL